ncbi:hypothetical protein AAG570_001381, partial [Ranatra chinensis]
VFKFLVTSQKLKKAQKICCKSYHKRRLNCPGKILYRVKNKTTRHNYRSGRITLCNRNWSRTSIHPFINFFRVFRRTFSRKTPVRQIEIKGGCVWKRMSVAERKPYIEQAKRAKHRGFRT